MKFIEDIFNIIISPDLQGALLPLKIVAIIFSVLLLGAIIYFLCVSSYLEQLYFGEWRDYKHWRDTYGPEAKKMKREMLKKERGLEKSISMEEASPVIKEDISISATEESNQTQSVLESEDLRQGRVERTDWERVLDRLEAKGELNYKLALIDADKIFINMLEKYGKDFSPESVFDFDEIMEAKSVLEKMLNNPKAVLTKERARELVGVYEKALKEMGEVDT
jgi:hypothetical protein